MKKKMIILLVLTMAATLLAGCRVAEENPTTESTQPTQTDATTKPTESTSQTEQTQPISGTATTTSAGILAQIWAQFAEDERFAAYGGTVEHAVDDAPGDLDMTNAEELTTKYLLPAEHVKAVADGASLVHLMNSNIFTASAFRLNTPEDHKAVAKAIRENVQSAQWICGQPDKLLIAQVEGHILTVFGSADIMNSFRQKLTAAYADAAVLYDEAITA